MTRIKIIRYGKEALTEYLARRRVRPAVLSHLEDSMRENEELGHLLAK